MRQLAAPLNIDASLCSCSAAARLFLARRSAAMRSRASASLRALKLFPLTAGAYHGTSAGKARETEAIHSCCDEHLRRVIETLRPEWVVGVGGFAFARVEPIAATTGVRAAQILHPSPASPAANLDWAGAATKQLRSAGVW